MELEVLTGRLEGLEAGVGRGSGLRPWALVSRPRGFRMARASRVGLGYVPEVSRILVVHPPASLQSRRGLQVPRGAQRSVHIQHQRLRLLVPPPS